MKILLAGPKVCTPWTEGRKRFMRDLAAALAEQHQVRVLTTVEAGQAADFAVPWEGPIADTRLAHLRRFHCGLGRELAQWGPDLVCHLPVSSFHGRFRYGNPASMWLADRQCARRSIPCFTLMYAIMQESSVATLRPWVRHLLVNQYTTGSEQVRFGVALPPEPVPLPLGPANELLFMAGMSEPTLERLDHVLRVRGLATLLKAGRWLAPASFRLTIAVPLLSNASLREALLSSPDNEWPVDRLELVGAMPVPEVFARRGFFVFPYGREEIQFVPTSVVEAMHSGVPIVVPRWHFLEPLIGDGSRAFAYHPNNPEDLARVLRSAAASEAVRRAVRDRAAEFVRNQMDIHGSCADILAIYRRAIGR